VIRAPPILYTALDSNLRPTYNLIELGLEDYEENVLVLDTIHDLMM